MSRLATKIGMSCFVLYRKEELTLIAQLLGSLLFCPDCGTLLNLPQDNEVEVKCEQCGHKEPASCESSLQCNV